MQGTIQWSEVHFLAKLRCQLTSSQRSGSSCHPEHLTGILILDKEICRQGIDACSSQMKDQTAGIGHLPLIRLRCQESEPRACVLSHVQLFATPWTVAHQAPLSMGFSRQEYWCGLHILLQGSSRPRDRTHISCIFCIGSRVLYHQHHLGNPNESPISWLSLTLMKCIIFCYFSDQ